MVINLGCTEKKSPVAFGREREVEEAGRSGGILI